METLPQISPGDSSNTYANTNTNTETPQQSWRSYFLTFYEYQPQFGSVLKFVAGILYGQADHKG